MWSKEAAAIAKFQEGVLTALDAQGFPVSVRQTSLAYDATNGELPIVLPETLGVVPGHANLLCHAHDDKLWNMKAISIKGLVERRGAQWVFVTTKYEPQSQLAMVGKMRRSAEAYVAKRGLPLPHVDYALIKRIWDRAKQVQDP